MFFRTGELQYHAKPDAPDPVFAKKVQELIGGQYGEMSVAMQYLFQGWSTRGNEKYKDLLMDTGTEELGILKCSQRWWQDSLKGHLFMNRKKLQVIQ